MDLEESTICEYCKKEINGYVETSRIDKNIKLCSNCYYQEMASIAIARAIKESENL